MSETTNTDSVPEIKGFIGNSEKIQPVIRRVATVTFRPAVKPRVHLRGESGVGKELIARAIHDNGPRKHKEFIPVNCGTIPNDLAESELFGHIKGAFTGATSDRTGAFREANGGTLFFDEVATFSIEVQAKLLRALQESQVRPMGQNKMKRVDVQVISATNQDLEAAVAQGKFRGDLYKRLVDAFIYIPALRTRPEDIPLLIEYWKNHLQTEYNVENIIVDPDAINYIQAHSLPGNVRDIQTFLRGALYTVFDKLGPKAWQPGKLETVEIRKADILDSQEEALSGEAGVVPTSAYSTLEEEVTQLTKRVVQLEGLLAQHGIKDSQEPLEPIYHLSAEDEAARTEVETFLEACGITESKINSYNENKRVKNTYEQLVDTLILVKTGVISSTGTSGQEALKKKPDYTKEGSEEEYKCWTHQNFRDLLKAFFPTDRDSLDTDHPLYDSEPVGVTVGNLFEALTKSDDVPLAPPLDD